MIRTTPRLFSWISILLLTGNHRQGDAFFHAITTPTFLSRTTNTRLFGGKGIATNYSWTEEPFELEIHITVPKGTTANNIYFKVLPRSIELRLRSEQQESDIVLLDPKRYMRGNICTDGTFWEIHDSENNERQITIQIEKNHKIPKDDFDVIDYDWGGVYPDDTDEVTFREYDEAEELNIREYAASLGVDIDNINMSLVDKTMFSKGINMTRSTMDQLTQKGLIQEITQQGNGQEFITDNEGVSVPFSPFPGIQSSTKSIDDPVQASKAGPIIDMEVANGEGSIVEEEDALDMKRITDPVDALTVTRLKDILKKQGLKISGNKEELRDRLRSHVKSMILNSGGGSDDDLTR